MEIYAFLYAVSAILSIMGWWKVFQVQRNDSGLFFLLFTIAAAAWLLLYYMLFANALWEWTLLTMSRSAFSLSIIGEYSLVLFVWNFHRRNPAWQSRRTWLVFALFAVLTTFYVFSWGIVESMMFDVSANLYREVYGPLYAVHTVLTLGFVPALIFASVRRISELNYINKTRLKMIIASIAALMGTLIFLQFLLPLWGIWIFEKWIVVLFVLFVASIVYITKRYYFSGIGYGIGRIVVYSASFLVAVIVLNISRAVLWPDSWIAFGYWITQDRYSFVETFIAIVSFLSAKKFLDRMLLGPVTKTVELKSRIHRLDEEISGITQESELIAFLSRRVRDIFKTDSFEIRRFHDTYSELGNFFDNHPGEKIFINDVVFIEENENKFEKSAMKSEFSAGQLIAMPISGVWRWNDRCYGAMVLGPKQFGDFYDADEISVLRWLSFSIWRQIKYIGMYREIMDLSENLDKKVDEKTIEYNELLNRQKEFISIVSHEVKAPISNAIFQADSIIDDMEDGRMTNELAISEMNVLNDQLLRMWGLVSRLFSMQYFETRDVKLFREPVHMGDFLRSEVSTYARTNEWIRFLCEISDSTGFVSVDRIQLQQVISNLLQNAVKFSNGRPHAKILVSASISDQKLNISIEDEGVGFKGVDVERIFERYATGTGSSVGLGLGLYLCKSIIELHGGVIQASVSEKFGGAKFSINMPCT